MESDKSNVAYFYYLIAGDVFFSLVNEDKKPTDEIYSNRVNGIIKLKEARITTSALAVSQQVIQGNFFRHNPPEKVAIRDVIIANIMPLGLMKDEEFNDIKVEQKTEPEKKEEAKK